MSIEKAHQNTWKSLSRRNSVLGLALTTLGLTAGPSYAQDSGWPRYPIKLIIPFPAGSGADLTARVVADYLWHELGQPIVSDNRPGASGNLGASLVASAKPDGYTMMLTSSSLAIVGEVYPNLSFKPATDFVGVAPVSYMATVYAASVSKGYHRIADLISASKTKKLTYASAGVGTITDLASKALSVTANLDATGIPYKGNVNAITDLLAGRVDYFLVPVAIALPFIKSGQLAAIAVAGKKRSELLPDTSTTVEQGYPSLDFAAWMAVFAPAKTPPNIVERFNGAINASLRDPEIRKRIEATGSTVFQMQPREFEEFFKAEIRRYAQLIKTVNLNGG